MSVIYYRGVIRGCGPTVFALSLAAVPTPIPRRTARRSSPQPGANVPAEASARSDPVSRSRMASSVEAQETGGYVGAAFTVSPWSVKTATGGSPSTYYANTTPDAVSVGISAEAGWHVTRQDSSPWQSIFRRAVA